MINGLNERVQRLNAAPGLSEEGRDSLRQSTISSGLYSSVIPPNRDAFSCSHRKVVDGSSLPKDEYRINGGLTGYNRFLRSDQRATVTFSPVANGESRLKAQIQDDVNQKRTVFIARLDKDGQIVERTFHGVQYPKVTPPPPEPVMRRDRTGRMVVEAAPGNAPTPVKYCQMRAQRLAREKREQEDVSLFKYLPHHEYDDVGTLAPFEDSLKKGSASHRFQKAFVDNNPAAAAAAINDGARISKHDNPAESVHRRLFVYEWPHLVRAGGRQKAEQFAQDVLIEEAALGFQIAQQEAPPPDNMQLSAEEIRVYAKNLVQANLADGQKERDITTVQRVFRGWRDRQALLRTEVTDATQLPKQAAKVANALIRKGL